MRSLLPPTKRMASPRPFHRYCLTSRISYVELGRVAFGDQFSMERSEVRNTPAVGPCAIMRNRRRNGKQKNENETQSTHEVHINNPCW